MSPFDLRQFVVLVGAGLVAYLLGLPYTMALSPVGVTPSPLTVGVAVLQTAVLLAVAVGVGQYFGSPVGLGAPVVTAALSGEAVPDRIRSFAPRSIGWGAAVGVALLVLDVGLLVATGRPTVVQGLPPLWTRALAAFYGGVFEELLLRFGLVSFFVWVSWKLVRADDGGPTEAAVWAAIAVAAVIFALGHLPIVVASGGSITPYLLVRSLLLNGLAGVVFGWLYWRDGLVAAVLAHFTADVVLHVVGLSVLDLLL
ncbi:MAG: type II CAAX prenyl endopeptidase Rce1 family protein [Halanaeroarchaeum sp.]